MGSIPVGVTNKTNATLAQLVEQLTCGIDKTISYFELSCTFIWKQIKWIPLIRGRLKVLTYANPELRRKILSVETLYGVPKAKS